jgi:AcrR family transcriptional regulator
MLHNIRARAKPVKRGAVDPVKRGAVDPIERGAMTPRPAIDDERVLAGARKALAKHGWPGVTLERIAEEAGVSRVTLHRRGVSKDALLGRLAERAIEEYRAALWPALTGPGDAAGRLEQALEALCDVAEANLALLLALGTASDAVFHEPGEEALTRAPFTEPLERLLRDGVADGTLDAADPVESATVLFNLVGWTYIHLRTGHGWPPERARSATLGVALDGVRKRRG